MSSSARRRLPARETIFAVGFAISRGIEVGTQPWNSGYDIPRSSMSTESLTRPEYREYEQYRALSISAVAAIVLGLMSLLTLLGVIWDAPSPILGVPGFGAIIGLYSLRKLKRHAGELTGLAMAKIGTMLSIGCLVLGAGYAQYRYATEVPDGYERIRFLDLEPKKSRPDLPVSPESLELHGKKVFVKGYVLSDDKGLALQNFAIVPDLGECCFGGSPKLYKMIGTKIITDQRVGFSFFKRGFGGTFEVDPRPKDPSGLQGPHYTLKADYVK